VLTGYRLSEVLYEFVQSLIEHRRSRRGSSEHLANREAHVPPNRIPGRMLEERGCRGPSNAILRNEPRECNERKMILESRRVYIRATRPTEHQVSLKVWFPESPEVIRLWLRTSGGGVELAEVARACAHRPP